MRNRWREMINMGKTELNIRIIDDFEGNTRLVPMQEVFLIWMMQEKTSKDVIQKTIFNNYPIWDDPKKDIDSYDIKLPERYCLACKQQIKGEIIVPISEGFYCNQYCFMNRIQQLGDDALDTLHDLENEVEKITGKQQKVNDVE